MVTMVEAVGPKRLRVYFDQNCMNARGMDAELRGIDALHDSGRIELVANPRNFHELKPGAYGALAQKRLARFAKGPETMRWGVSYWGEAVWADANSKTLDITQAFAIIFPNQNPLDQRAANSLHDVMHIANAEDHEADVFLTREKAILAARELLGLRLRLMSPTELLTELETDGDHDGH